MRSTGRRLKGKTFRMKGSRGRRALGEENTANLTRTNAKSSLTARIFSAFSVS